MIKEHHLVSHAYVHGDGRSYLVAGIVESANRRVSSSESVRRFRILPRDFRPDLDEVTLKLKRDVVARHFEDVLQGLYA
jgi:long-chain acyl-CoA synthetase